MDFINNNEYLCHIDRPLKVGLNDMLREIIINTYFFKYKINGFDDAIKQTFNELTLVSMLFSFYQLNMHLKPKEEYPSEELLRRYYAVVEYVMAHIHEKITVEDVMQHFFMNNTYFSQFMKKMGGVGFKEFVQYRKIILIEGYLLDETLSMVDIASQMGIYDMKSFYNSFKRYFKHSPKTWRDQMKLIKDDYEVEENFFVDRKSVV